MRKQIPNTAAAVFLAGLATAILVALPSWGEVFDLTGNLAWSFRGDTDDVVASLETSTFGTFTTEIEIEDFLNLSSYSVSLKRGAASVFTLDNSNSVWDLELSGSPIVEAVLTSTPTHVRIQFLLPDERASARLTLRGPSPSPSMSYYEASGRFAGAFISVLDSSTLQEAYCRNCSQLIFPLFPGHRIHTPFSVVPNRDGSFSFDALLRVGASGGNVASVDTVGVENVVGAGPILDGNCAGGAWPVEEGDEMVFRAYGRLIDLGQFGEVRVNWALCGQVGVQASVPILIVSHPLPVLSPLALGTLNLVLLLVGLISLRPALLE
jgi:hypothetical protein